MWQKLHMTPFMQPFLEWAKMQTLHLPVKWPAEPTDEGWPSGPNGTFKSEMSPTGGGDPAATAARCSSICCIRSAAMGFPVSNSSLSFSPPDSSSAPFSLPSEASSLCSGRRRPPRLLLLAAPGPSRRGGSDFPEEEEVSPRLKHTPWGIALRPDSLASLLDDLTVLLEDVSTLPKSTCFGAMLCHRCTQPTLAQGRAPWAACSCRARGSRGPLGGSCWPAP
mmetsp:Transcript_15260/g.48100  ORF Transcript_15260/g.48100 Transcript_15260/m.48100 type:complete len:222 (-) Transcript_15260:12-677(-)